MNKKYNDSQIIELHSASLTDREIAEIIGVTPNNMATKRRALGLQPNKGKKGTYMLTKEELEILVGILLGDATVRYVHNQCKFPNLTFSHSIAQEEYFNWLTNKLSNLKSSTGKYKSSYVRTNGEIAERLTFTGSNMLCLKEIQEIFYKEDKKIIPIDYINNNFSELSLYCLFMDDGSYDISTNSYIINTQCFDKNNLEAFVQLLYNKFGLEFNIKSDNSLYLKHSSNEKMLKLLSKINECDSMQYKCGSHRKTPLNRETPEMDNPVLNPQEIEENAERLEVMPNEKDEAIKSSTKAGHCSK